MCLMMSNLIHNDKFNKSSKENDTLFQKVTILNVILNIVLIIA